MLDGAYCIYSISPSLLDNVWNYRLEFTHWCKINGLNLDAHISSFFGAAADAGPNTWCNDGKKLALFVLSWQDSNRYFIHRIIGAFFGVLPCIIFIFRRCSPPSVHNRSQPARQQCYTFSIVNNKRHSEIQTKKKLLANISMISVRIQHDFIKKNRCVHQK